VLLASGLIHVGILAVSGGSWHGPLSLRKAATFGVSFGLTLVTVVWVASFLRLSDRSRAALLGTFTVACVLETGLVSLQAWRGVPSHYNLETTFDALIARTLAAGGAALIAVIVALTLAAFRANPTVPVSLRVAIRIGLVTLVIALIVGALMIAKGMLLVFAGSPQAAYATGGALKPTHAVTMHGILVLPVLAWCLSFVSWTERRRLGVVLLGGSGYVVLAGVVAVENVTGQMSSPSPFAVVAFSLGLLALMSAGLLALGGLVHASGADGIEHSSTPDNGNVARPAPQVPGRASRGTAEDGPPAV
jgi:hypothetical protein